MIFFYFPVLIKVLFTVYCNLLSVQEITLCLKMQCTHLNLKMLLLKTVNHHLSLAPIDLFDAGLPQTFNL